MSTTAEAIGYGTEKAPALDCAWIDDYDDFVALGREWDALERDMQGNHPFLSHAWLRTWWEHFGAGHALRVLLVRSCGRLVGAAPLMLTNTRFYGVRVRVLQAMAGDHSPRFEFLAGHGNAVAVHAALWAALRKCGDAWDVLNVRQLPEDALTLRELEVCAAGAGLRTGRWSGERSPFVRFAGAWNRYFDSLGYNHRRNVGKGRRRLERQGELRLETVSDGAAAVDEGIRIEASAWKADAGTAIACDPMRLGFYRAIADRLARQGKLRLYFLRCGDTRIAFSYALVSDGIIYVLKSGYDPKYAKFSPYTVLCAMVLQQGFASGLRGYDFLGDAEPWKRAWSRSARAHCWLYVFAPRLRAQWVYLLKFRVFPLLRTLFLRTG